MKKDLLDEREPVADTCAGTSAESELVSPQSWNMVRGVGDRIPSLWSVTLDKPPRGGRGDTGVLELQSVFSPRCFAPVDHNYGDIH